MTLQDLAETEHIDPEMVPAIVPVDARLLIAMTTKELTELVSRIVAIVPAREVIPGTSMMLIEAVAGTGDVPHIRISASDGSQWMQVTSSGPIRVGTPGSVVVPAKKILDALKVAPEALVRFSVIGSQAVLLSGRAQWTFSTPLSDRLTATPDQEDVEMFSVPAQGLLRALQDVLPASDQNSSRPAFLQVNIANGEAVATDGARLHKSAVEGIFDDIAFDIPLRVAPRIVDLLQRTDMVAVGVNESRVYFQVEDARIVSQRILLPFPDVTPVLMGSSMTNSGAITAKVQEVLNAVSRVRINSDPDRSSIRLLTVTLADGQWALAFSSQDRNGNEAQEVVDAQWSRARPVEVTLNHRHLVDTLKRLTEEHVILRVDETRGAKSPLLVNENGFTAVLAPML